MHPTLLLIIVCILLTACRLTLPQDKTVLARRQHHGYRWQCFASSKENNKSKKPDQYDMALYSLLMSKLLDKNGQYIESDSLIRIAVDYYSSNKEPGRAGYACFYLSRCERNIGNAQGQLNALLKTIVFPKNSHDNKTNCLSASIKLK